MQSARSPFVGHPSPAQSGILVLAASLALPILLLGSPATQSSVVIAEYEGDGQFTYAVDFMTDLDHRCAGQPGNGSMYCVPSARMNLLTHAANLSVPDLFLEPDLWEGGEERFS